MDEPGHGTALCTVSVCSTVTVTGGFDSVHDLDCAMLEATRTAAPSHNEKWLRRIWRGFQHIQFGAGSGFCDLRATLTLTRPLVEKAHFYQL